MIDLGKKNVLGVMVDATDREGAVARVVKAAEESTRFAASALAVHGVMTGRDGSQRARLNALDLVVPDGQPVRWALNLMYRTGLDVPVRGTDFARSIIECAARKRLPVYFYGSRPDVLAELQSRLLRAFPDLQVAGLEPSKFRRAEGQELDQIAAHINASGARVVLVGLGCPRQESFVYEMRPRVDVPLVAVGAAFDYMAGSLREPPQAMSRNGLEWLWRLALEPRRLWRRYLVLNPYYVVLLALQATGVWSPRNHSHPTPPAERVSI